MNAATFATPWYRQFWPWVLIALPTSAVLACAATAWLILKYPEHEVAHDAPLPVNEVMGKSSVVPPKQ
jgi:hypothetical protein